MPSEIVAQPPPGAATDASSSHTPKLWMPSPDPGSGDALPPAPAVTPPWCAWPCPALFPCAAARGAPHHRNEPTTSIGANAGIRHDITASYLSLSRDVCFFAG